MELSMIRKLKYMTLSLFGAALLFTPALRAEDAKAPEKASTQRQDRMKKMAEELGLTSDQEVKVAAIMKDQSKEMKALREDTSLEKEQKSAKAKSIHEATKTKLQAILNKEQLEKWETLSQRRGRKKA